MVLGEALIDLLEIRAGDDPVYRPVVGGGPLNVAVGVAALGGRVEFVGSIGDDAFGRRILRLLHEAGVGHQAVRTVAAATTLAVTTFDGAEPEFHFYGEPRSYGLLRSEDLDLTAVCDAAAIYCGSIALLCEPTLAAARRVWAQAGGVRTFDPNVRPNLGVEMSVVREVAEEFSAGADLVKLSAADAAALYGVAPRLAAERLAELGAGAVVVTLGADGALVHHGGRFAVVAGARVEPVDATGAGDATMAALIAGILADGLPGDLAAWVRLTTDAMQVAALVCESPGGAMAMPTRDQVERRFGRT